VRRNSSVGIVTRYELGDLRIQTRWEETFCIRQDRPWGQTSLLYYRYQATSGGLSGQGVTLTTRSYLAARLKKE